MRVRIEANTKEMSDRLNEMVVNQIPFALARTVTKVATMTRDEQLFQEYNNFFDMRNKPFFRTVHSVAPADLRFAKQTGVAIAGIQRLDSPRPVGTLQVRGSREVRTEFMRDFVSGSIRTPQKSKIAVPFEDANLPRLKGGRTAGAIVANKKPKAILQGRGFILKTKKNKLIIFRRVGRGKSSTVEAMYHLQDSVKMKRGYNPLRAARVGVRKHLKGTFTRNFRKAIFTAKLR
jgi:hypothetical protein